MAESAYIGTDLKFLVEPTATGFNPATDQFEVTISCGEVSQTWTKSQLATDTHGNYYVCFSTSTFGNGIYYITVVTHTPDSDFTDGYREDVVPKPLIKVLNTP